MNNKINVAIVDDSDFCIECLCNSLSGYSNIEVCGVAQNAGTGKKIILEQCPDLLFLDIELPDMTGLELLRELNQEITWSMQVVFYTAYDKYLLDALRESAFDFLLKPFEKAELDLVMDRYFNYMKKEQTNNSFQDSLTRLLPNNSIFMVTTVNGFQILRLEQIGYFKYLNDRKQWIVVLNDLKELQLKRNTCAKDILKYSPSFEQINRDQIINIDYLAMIKGKECVLFPPFEQVTDLYASFSFIRVLQEKFSQI
jgi:two-component system, LytTR family, response regulator